MLISIDHGNKQIKTNHRTFVSGLRESDTRPPFGKDVLFYKGKYYTLTDQRIPYMRDKTADERYLFGKLRERMIDLRSGKAVFVGGGSILLKKQIEASGKVSAPIFVDEISANTQGYELLFKAACMG